MASRSRPRAADVLESAVDLAADLTRIRDAETGWHLERVRQYTWIIARGLPEPPDDAFVEDLTALAHAHDVGKLAIPDHILLKDGGLDPDEFDVMKGHVLSGVAIVEEILRDFGLAGTQRASMLRNIVRSHHESLDGSGYPDGLRDGEIPLEARIVSVADVFDALTSARPYKRVWTTAEAIAYLEERAGRRFDADCVVALAGRAGELDEIRAGLATPEA
jgi:HD-GYP domain-containing protein (c-di-GMP phosphodiesterase class II)